MPSISSMQRDAERKRLMADALEEEARSNELRKEAEVVGKRALEMKSKAQESTTGEIIGIVIGIGFWLLVGIWVYGQFA